jgi:universal stress protein A
MRPYRKILLAVDLTADTAPVAERAKALAAIHGAEIALVHVVEPVPVVTPLDIPEVMTPATLEAQEMIADRARERLRMLAAELGVPASRAEVVIGNTKAEIVRAAREGQADLIVLGGRERHGLSLLVDFTEDAVLHKAPCDVLAVRVKPTA